MKIDKLIVHDGRVEGIISILQWPKLYMVNESTPLKQCIDRVVARAKAQGGLDNLEILAHGRVTYTSGDGQACLPNWTKGFGIQLCKENLTFKTVGLTAAWKGLIKRITLYSCGVAHTATGNENTGGDGQRFCGELAVWSGAEVIASNYLQKYKKYSPVFLDVGAWEGQVYRFDPNDGKSTPFKP